MSADAGRRPPAPSPGGCLVSVIVPVRDDAARLSACLASIRANRWDGGLELIVVDNGSRDDSATVARAAGAAVIVLPGRRVAALRNAAAATARGQVLAFADADHVIDPAWIQSAVGTLVRPGIGAVGAPYLPPVPATWVQRAYDRLRSHRPGVRDATWLGSGNLAVTRRAFDAVGGFDATLQTCEDVDLCNRLRAAGYRTVSDDRLRSRHTGDPASLRAVLFGELWRGRDNLRVTLRGPWTPRTLVGLAVTLASLGLLVVAGAGLVVWPWAGPGPAAAGAGGLLAVVGLRAARMTVDSGAWRAVDLAGSLAVAAVYEVARALALVLPGGHRLRRELAGQRP